jgi:hypothetical protein
MRFRSPPNPAAFGHSRIYEGLFGGMALDLMRQQSRRRRCRKVRPRGLCAAAILTGWTPPPQPPEGECPPSNNASQPRPFEAPQSRRQAIHLGRKARVKLIFLA